MRIASAVVLATLGGCAAAPEDADDDPVDPPITEPPARGFQLKSPEQVIRPRQEVTYCWYFQTPNDEMMAVKRWRSSMTSGAQYMVMYTTTGDKGTVGEMSPISCGIANAGGSSFPQWTYSTHDLTNDLKFPADDGEGKPLALEIAPHQSGFIQLRYANRSDREIIAQVTLNAEALQPGEAYTETAPYATYNPDIVIPDLKVNHTQSGTCNVAPTSKFWSMTTRTHMYGRRAAVRNGMPTSTAMAFENTNWEHPSVTRWDTGNFYTFDSGKLTYECTWDNNTNSRIVAGDDAVLDEICMASGYYFPAIKPTLCYGNDSGI